MLFSITYYFADEYVLLCQRIRLTLQLNTYCFIRSIIGKKSLLSMLFYRKFLYCQIKCVSLRP